MFSVRQEGKWPMNYEELKTLMKSCRESRDETVKVDRKRLMDILQEVMQGRRSKAARLHRNGVLRSKERSGPARGGS